MDALYVFLIRNDVWIYILCVLGLLWFISEFLRSQSALRRAMFRLERETALTTRNSALFFILLLGGIASGVAYVNVQIRPTLPAELLRPPTPTPEPGLALPMTPTPAVTELAPTPTSPIPPTVTLSEGTAMMTGTVATAPGSTVEPATEEDSDVEELVAGCEDGAAIDQPRSLATVRGTLNVLGTANTADFGHYALEIRGPQTNDRWADLLGRTIQEPVDDGILGGNLNLAEWGSGPYQLRLTVADDGGRVTHRCVVDFRLDNS